MTLVCNQAESWCSTQLNHRRNNWIKAEKRWLSAEFSDQLDHDGIIVEVDVERMVAGLDAAVTVVHVIGVQRLSGAILVVALQLFGRLLRHGRRMEGFQSLVVQLRASFYRRRRVRCCCCLFVGCCRSDWIGSGTLQGNNWLSGRSDVFDGDVGDVFNVFGRRLLLVLLAQEEESLFLERFVSGYQSLLPVVLFWLLAMHPSDGDDDFVGVESTFADAADAADAAVWGIGGWCYAHGGGGGGKTTRRYWKDWHNKDMETNLINELVSD